MIVSLGDAVIDLFAWPLGSDAATAEHFVPRAGGAPCNVARSAAILGARTRFVGAVGPDGHGARLRAALEQVGADTRYLATLPPRTGVTFVRVGLDGSRTFTAYRQGAADLRLGPDELASLGGDPLEGAHWLHLTSGSVLGEPLASTAMLLADRARERGVSVSVDLNVRPAQWDDAERMQRNVRDLCARASVLKASDEDLAALGLAGTSEALRGLLSEGAVGLLTLAERGAIALWGAHGEAPAGEVRADAPSVKLVDPIGAGDAFVAATLAGLEAQGIAPRTGAFYERNTWESLLAIACEAGAVAVTAMGATEALSQSAQRLREKLGALLRRSFDAPG